MKFCSSSNIPSEGGSSTAFQSTALLALLRWLVAGTASVSPGSTTVGPSTSFSEPQHASATSSSEPQYASVIGESQVQAECPAGIDQEWKWHCGMELNIFTDGKPADLFAIAALFGQANRASSALHCRPDQYPIKAIISGGGYSTITTDLIVKRHLRLLQVAEIVPERAWFDCDTQVLQGPGAYDAYNPQDVIGAGAWDEDWASPDFVEGYRNEDGPFVSGSGYLAQSMDLLIDQAAPIIVAMRPVVEFSFLWTEYNAFANPNGINTTSVYKQARQEFFSSDELNGTSSMWPDLELEAKVRKALDAFSRSRITLFQGRTSLAGLGLYFEKYVMNTAETASAVQRTKDMEEAFIKLPLQVLVVDREGILSNSEFELTPIFTRFTVPGVFAQLRALTWMMSHLRSYVHRWNSVSTDFSARKVRKILRTLPNFSGSKLEMDYSVLGQKTARIFRGPYHDQVDHIQMQNWSDDVERLKGRLAASFNFNLFRITGIHGSSSTARKAARALTNWAHSAVNEGTFVIASSILLPFCLSLETSLVEQSFQRVHYQGKDESGNYVWPLAGASQSSIWFTNTSNQLNFTDAAARQRRLESELEQMYIAAFTPSQIQ